ncbi:unnamed protein product [Sphagnum jensenii]|uniref:Uncharacterized protein n=1 Tax=Sphagnum jensenii TaxID=128206 RepID=A0ABP0WC94_9BRYO
MARGAYLLTKNKKMKQKGQIDKEGDGSGSRVARRAGGSGRGSILDIATARVERKEARSSFFLGGKTEKQQQQEKEEEEEEEEEVNDEDRRLVSESKEARSSILMKIED